MEATKSSIENLKLDKRCDPPFSRSLERWKTQIMKLKSIRVWESGQRAKSHKQVIKNCQGIHQAPKTGHPRYGVLPKPQSNVEQSCGDWSCLKQPLSAVAVVLIGHIGSRSPDLIRDKSAPDKRHSDAQSPITDSI